MPSHCTEVPTLYFYSTQSEECCAISDKEINKNNVKLIITYYLGWKMISYGRRYEPSSGNAFIVGSITRVVSRNPPGFLESTWDLLRRSRCR